MMSAALALDSGQIEAVTRATQTPRASELGALAENLREWTRAIETHWDDMPPSVQVAFRNVAHDLEHPPKVSLWKRLKFAYAALRAGPEEFTEYMDAVIKFRDVLLDTLAREQNAFDRMIHDEALLASAEQGWADLEAGNTIPLEEAIERLEQD